jgi:hypothetical protein
MDDKYVHDLESTIELMIDKNKSLEHEKEEAERSLNNKQEYLRNVIQYLVCKLEESNCDTWEALQDISKLDKKRPSTIETKQATLVSDYVLARLGIDGKKVIKL